MGNCLDSSAKVDTAQSCRTNSGKSSYFYVVSCISMFSLFEFLELILTVLGNWVPILDFMVVGMH